MSSAKGKRKEEEEELELDVALAAMETEEAEKKQKLKERRKRKRDEKKRKDYDLMLHSLSNISSEEAVPKKQKASSAVACSAAACSSAHDENVNPTEEDLLAWTTTRKTWSNVREEAMAEWELSRPYIFSSFLKSQVLDQPCETCDEQASVLCTDGCGAFCHQCDYEAHCMKPTHERNGIVRYECSVCSGTADTRCLLCEQVFCTECHTSIEGHEIHAVQPCVGIPVTLSGSWYLVDRFNVGRRDTYLRTFSTRCCAKEMTLEARSKIAIVNFKGKYEGIIIPFAICESCDNVKETKLKDLLGLNLFPGSPSQQIRDGMEFYDMAMLKLVEVLRREDPSLALRTLIQSIQTSSKSRDGPISAQNFYDTYREHSFMQYSIAQLTEEVYTSCPACKDSRIACHFDGNHKLFRYSNCSNETRESYMGDKFFVPDSDVEKCVKKFRSSKTSQPGTCGGTTLQGARSFSKKYKHLDETGTVMACCRHNIVLKGLNMKRGEVYAYPLCLQLQLPPHQFMAQDVICQYRPWLEGVVSRHPEDEDVAKLLTQRPFLSVLHAYAHSWHCQVLVGGRYQVGAGMTTGEELEQCHAKLSRAAVTTRVMSKPRREEELALLVFYMNKKHIDILPQTLNKRKSKNDKQLIQQQNTLIDLLRTEEVTEEQIYEYKEELQSIAKDLKGRRKVNLDQKKKQIEILSMTVKRALGAVRNAGSSKARQRLASKSSSSNAKLTKLIEEYNVENEDKITESHRKDGVWPWQSSLLRDLSTKRTCVDVLMKRDRMVEEQAIIKAEMVSLHSQLIEETFKLYFQEITPHYLPYQEGKYSCVLDDVTTRAVIAKRNQVARRKAALVEKMEENDPSLLDTEFPDGTRFTDRLKHVEQNEVRPVMEFEEEHDVTEDGLIRMEEPDFRVIEEFEEVESESEDSD